MEKRGIVLDCLLVLFAGVVMYMMVYGHESVHEKIFNYGGCIETKISIFALPPNTRCLNYTTIYNPELTYALHAENEIIGYQVMPFLVVITFLLMLLLIGVYSRT